MKKIDIKIRKQLRNECAIECLASVINYFGNTNYENKILSNEVGKVEWKWRNWDYLIATLALKKGFKAQVFTRSTQVFDPSWFCFNSKNLIKKLEATKRNLQKAIMSESLYKDFYIWRHPQYELYEISAALDFLKNEGEIIFKKINDKIIKNFIDKKIPVFFPHNATLLHLKKRKGLRGADDILGHHWGHVALIVGYDDNNYMIADPNKNISGSHYYIKDKESVLESIIRFDQNIYVVYK